MFVGTPSSCLPAFTSVVVRPNPWTNLACPHGQEYVLAGLLIDLSLLDQYMFRFRPGTLTAAALFLARVTAMYYSKVRPCLVER